MDRTLFACSKDRDVFAVHGVCLSIEEGSNKIVACGTDGRRLSEMTAETADSLPMTKKVIVPLRALKQLSKALSSGNSPTVSIAITDTQFMVKGEAAVMIAQLIEGVFPEYANIIPTTFEIEVGLIRATLISAIQRAAIMSSVDAAFVELCFDEKGLVVKSLAGGAGDAKVEVSFAYEQKPFSVLFNPDMLVDGLKTMDGETVTLKSKDEKSAFLFCGDGEQDKSHRFVVMPVSQEGNIRRCL